MELRFDTCLLFSHKKYQILDRAVRLWELLLASQRKRWKFCLLSNLRNQAAIPRKFLLRKVLIYWTRCSKKKKAFYITNRYVEATHAVSYLRKSKMPTKSWKTSSNMNGWLTKISHFARKLEFGGFLIWREKVCFVFCAENIMLAASLTSERFSISRVLFVSGNRLW